MPIERARLHPFFVGCTSLFLREKLKVPAHPVPQFAFQPGLILFLILRFGTRRSAREKNQGFLGLFLVGEVSLLGICPAVLTRPSRDR
jgi:hypothetical protein